MDEESRMRVMFEIPILFFGGLKDSVLCLSTYHDLDPVHGLGPDSAALA